MTPTIAAYVLCCPNQNDRNHYIVEMCSASQILRICYFFQFVNVRIVLYSISNNVKFPSFGVSLIDNIIKCPTFPQNHVVASHAVGARRQRLTRVILWHFGSISARCDNNKTFPPRGTYLPNPVLLFFFCWRFLSRKGERVFMLMLRANWKSDRVQKLLQFYSTILPTK